MASSNRHWPSMFKSKPHHQWQHDINSSLISTGCQRTPYTSAGCEERSPEPKPRWNPKPEQIRILEAIFNSGMVNPPRDEIRKIRAQLQEYGQVGDANVFYWFQNRKSRSKHKLRNLQSSKAQAQQISPQVQNKPTTLTTSSLLPATSTTPSSSSSSSEKSSPKSIPQRAFSTGLSDVVSASPTAYEAVFPAEPFLFPVQQAGSDQGVVSSPAGLTQGLYNMSHELPGLAPSVSEHVNVGPCTSLLLSEIMNIHGGSNMKKAQAEQEKVIMKMQHQQPYLSFSVSCAAPTSTHTVVAPISTSAATVPSPVSLFQGATEPGSAGPATGFAKQTVFINDVALEVNSGPFCVREAFGHDAVLIHSSGQPVLTNEWGVTLQPLQPGSFYYLVRKL